MLFQMGIKSMDALHLACAISAGAAYFLTTDKGILRKMAQDTRIRALDPIAFLSEYRGGNDED